MSTLIWQHSPKTACPCSYVLNQILSGDEVDTVVSKVQHYLEEGGRGTLAWCGVGGAHWPDVGWEWHIGLVWGGSGTLAWCGVGGAHWPGVGWEGHIGLMWGGRGTLA